MAKSSKSSEISIVELAKQLVKQNSALQKQNERQERTIAKLETKLGGSAPAPKSKKAAMCAPAPAKVKGKKAAMCAPKVKGKKAAMCAPAKAKSKKAAKAAMCAPAPAKSKAKNTNFLIPS